MAVRSRIYIGLLSLCVRLSLSWTMFAVWMMLCVASVGAQSSCSSLQYQGDDRCCSKCPAGSYVLRDCTHTAETFCTACRKGEYMDAMNGQMHCLKCSHCDQEYGFKELQNCTATRPRICSCAEGFDCEHKSDEGGCKTCKRRLTCQTGEGAVTTGSHTNGTVCKPCLEGFFTSHPSGQPCQPWTRCEELGMETLQVGSPVSDSECGHRQANSLLGIAVGLSAAVIISSTLLLVYIYIQKRRGTITVT
ncbi:tumor necrosis factor receptor superfamily member 5-like isoform X2 [Carcharodon carcharias]|uniref:tumor necrosis factor receptor superfamily member 5-like isoform X2 n=1 Tax=Carcharodon carcharias TaxID=13397 RepID=UPI001B7E2852|nr:tumor necrosis factor receptor superfamily member 5-like isoform X2 [Carcharodon carcharias]